MTAAVARTLSPHKRLEHHGVDSVSDVELLAVLLSNGHRGARVKTLARVLLKDYGGLAGLADAKGSYRVRQGMDDGKGSTLAVAFEIACRLTKTRMPRRDLLDRPDAVASYLSLRYGQLDQEVMGALYLDVRNRLISEEELYRGTLTRAAVEPRAIMKQGLLCSASAIVLFHTHPSGDPSPSDSDLSFTRRVAEAGELLGIKLVDHLILGSFGRWVSLGRRGGF